jgi:hypothetical protein
MCADLSHPVALSLGRKTETAGFQREVPRQIFPKIGFGRQTVPQFVERQLAPVEKRISEVTASQDNVIEVAVEESATYKFAIGQLSPTEIATDKYAVLKFRVLQDGFFETDIGERAALEAALFDFLLIEQRTPEDAVLALEWLRDGCYLLSEKVNR